MSYTFNKTYQRKVVAMLFREKTFLPKAINIIKPNHFKKEEYIWVVYALFKFYRRYNYIPRKKEFYDYLKKVLKRKRKDEWYEPCKDAFIRAIRSELSDTGYIKDTLIEWMQNEEFSNAIEDSIDNQGNVNKEELLVSLVKIQNYSQLFDSGYYDYKKELRHRLDTLQKMRDLEYKSKTHIQEIDENLEFGGLSGGELLVFMAPTNRGKSLVLGNIARANIENNKNILMFTLEMRSFKHAVRIDQQIIGESKYDLADNVVQSRKSLKKILKNYGRLLIKKYQMRQATVGMLESYVTSLRIEEGFEPDLVLVDYADILRSATKKNNKKDEQTEIYEDLVGMAERLDLPVVTASQANRASLTSKVVDLHHVAEDIQKCNVADVVIALNQTKKMRKSGRLNLYFAKNRDEPAGKVVKSRIDYTSTKLFPVKDDEDEE